MPYITLLIIRSVFSLTSTRLITSPVSWLTTSTNLAIVLLLIRLCYGCGGRCRKMPPMRRLIWHRIGIRKKIITPNPQRDFFVFQPFHTALLSIEGPNLRTILRRSFNRLPHILSHPCQFALRLHQLRLQQRQVSRCNCSLSLHCRVVRYPHGIRERMMAQRLSQAVKVHTALAEFAGGAILPRFDIDASLFASRAAIARLVFVVVVELMHGDLRHTDSDFLRTPDTTRNDRSLNESSQLSPLPL